MADPNIYEEDPDDTFSYEDDWKEAIDMVQPGGGDHVSSNGQEAVLVGYIPFGKIRSAERFFLGHSYADEGSPYKLHREPKHRHPRRPQLYAYSFSSQGLGPKPDPENPNRETYATSPFTDLNGDDMFFAAYQQALCTVRYRSWGRMRFLTDDQISDYGDEWKRWSTWSTDTNVEALTADGSSQLLFRQGRNAETDPGMGPIIGSTAFPAPIAEILAKAALTLTILELPHNYISSDPDLLYPKKTIGLPSSSDPSGGSPVAPCRLGTLNKLAFLGFQPGELLMTAFKAEPMLFPVTTSDPDGYPATGWNATWVWEYFEPSKPYIPSSPSDRIYGHRLFPWRRDGLWYHATREDTNADMIPMTDHWGIFSHQADPSI